MADITLTDLTDGTVGGRGVFDKLMEATKAHLESQFNQGRIKGPEYASVYLGSLQAVMQTALTFVTQQQEINLKAQLMTQQVLLTQAEVAKAQAEVLVAQQEVETAKATVLLTQAQVIKIEQENQLIPKQSAHLDAEVALLNQQVSNTAAEGLNIPKQGAQIDAQTSLIGQQVLTAVQEVEVSKAKVLQANAEVANLTKQGQLIDAQVALAGSNKTKTDAETLVVPKQGAQIDAQTSLVNQQELNAVQENKNLIAQECLLRAQFDEAEAQVLSVGAQTDLYKQKLVTEKAQTQAVGVDDNSVIGRQKMLYKAQTDGFARDGEQKVMAQLIQAWNTQRMTDDTLVANSTNMLDAATIGRAVSKALAGIGA